MREAHSIRMLSLGLPFLLGCSAHPEEREVGPSVATPGPALEIPISDYLARHFEIMDRSASDEELLQSLADLRSRDQIVAEVNELYQALTDADASESDIDGLGYARWKAVNLLGSLGDVRAIEPLSRIAQTPLPTPEISETRFKVEYRIRLRAIAGLENLKAVDQLNALLNQGGPLRGAVAASLYELGHAPKGVVEVDKRDILRIIDVPTSRESQSQTPGVGDRSESTVIVPESNKRN